MEENNCSEFYEYIKTFRNKKIAFYGASLYLQEFLKLYDLSEYNILGIIDRDHSKIGTFVENYQIYKLEDIINKIDNIIFAIKNNSCTNYVGLLSQYPNIKEKLAQNFFEKQELDKLSSNKLYVFDSCGTKKQVSSINGLNIDFTGENSIIEVSLSACKAFVDCNIRCQNNNYVKIDSTVHHIKGLNAFFQNNTKLIIGKNFSLNGAKIMLSEYDDKICIGNDCMFSWGIIIRTSDGHVIIDKKTNKVINYAENINIGNHVWLGQNVTLLKGAVISDNSVVGASSLVNKKFNTKNCIIAGAPAKVVKKNIDWDRELPSLCNI